MLSAKTANERHPQKKATTVFQKKQQPFWPSLRSRTWQATRYDNSSSTETALMRGHKQRSKDFINAHTLPQKSFLQSQKLSIFRLVQSLLKSFFSTIPLTVSSFSRPFWGRLIKQSSREKIGIFLCSKLQLYSMWKKWVTPIKPKGRHIMQKWVNFEDDPSDR